MNDADRLDDYDAVVLVIEREWIESGSVNKMMSLLRPLLVDSSIIQRFAGTVDLVFHGWDDDLRELPEIPEVKQWFRQLTEVFPYWFVFLNRTTYSIPLAINLLLDSEVHVRDVGGEIGYLSDEAQIDGIVEKLLRAQKTLCEKYRLEDCYNKWASEVLECINAFRS